MVVRMLPSEPGFVTNWNLVGSTASVFCCAAPLAHLNVPAVEAIFACAAPMRSCMTE